MANRSLSDTSVTRLEPRKTSYDVFDRMPGFGVRVHKTGRKVYCTHYRDRLTKKSVRITIGPIELYGLDEAREKARQLLKEVREGKGPRQQRQSRRASSLALTMEAQLGEYEAYLKANRPRSARERLRVLRKDCAPLLGRCAKDIQKKDLVTLFEDILSAGKPSAARHAFANCSAFFSWMVDRDVIQSSPFSSMRQPVGAQKRQRVLSDDEIGRVWEALELMGYPYGPVGQLLLLTGQRRSEVGSMRWQDLNTAERFWIIPRHLTKSDRTHLVPLSSGAMAILCVLPRLDETWVFPGTTGRGPICGWSKWKASLDRYLPNMPSWVVHDLRRTVYSQLGRLKVPPDIKERIVNHSRPRLQEIYDLYEYQDEKREALDQWSVRLAQLVRRSTDNSACNNVAASSKEAAHPDIVHVLEPLPRSNRARVQQRSHGDLQIPIYGR